MAKYEYEMPLRKNTLSMKIPWEVQRERLAEMMNIVPPWESQWVPRDVQWTDLDKENWWNDILKRPSMHRPLPLTDDLYHGCQEYFVGGLQKPHPNAVPYFTESNMINVAKQSDRLKLSTIKMWRLQMLFDLAEAFYGDIESIEKALRPTPESAQIASANVDPAFVDKVKEQLQYSEENACRIEERDNDLLHLTSKGRRELCKRNTHDKKEKITSFELCMLLVHPVVRATMNDVGSIISLDENTVKNIRRIANLKYKEYLRDINKNKPPETWGEWLWNMPSRLINGLPTWKNFTIYTMMALTAINYDMIYKHGQNLAGASGRIFGSSVPQVASNQLISMSTDYTLYDRDPRFKASVSHSPYMGSRPTTNYPMSIVSNKVHNDYQATYGSDRPLSFN